MLLIQGFTLPDSEVVAVTQRAACSVAVNDLTHLMLFGLVKCKDRLTIQKNTCNRKTALQLTSQYFTVEH